MKSRVKVIVYGIALWALLPWSMSYAAADPAPITEPTTQNSILKYADDASTLIGVPVREPNAPGDPSQSAIVAINPPPPAAKNATTEPTTEAATEPAASRGEWLIAPLPSHNPEFGWGITATLGYIFPLDPNDKVSPPSTVAGIGYYSQNSSWAGGLVGKFYIDEDRYRVTAGGFHGEINYNFFGIGTDAGNSGKSVPLQQAMTGGVAEVLFKVFPNVYLGPHYQGAKMNINADTSQFNFPKPIPSVQFDTTSSGLGLHGQWDTRDSQFYPHKGLLVDGDANFHDPSLGDSFAYQVYQLSYNQFVSLSPRQVLAFRLMGQFESGDVPFYALSTFGRGSDLRGYRPGQYQDKQMLAGQVEYRLEITKRIGAVAFGGVGEVVPALNNLNWNDLLPSGGVGLRFVVAEKNHVSIRVDGAWGKDGGVFYLGVGEAF